MGKLLVNEEADRNSVERLQKKVWNSWISQLKDDEGKFEYFPSNPHPSPPPSIQSRGPSAPPPVPLPSPALIPPSLSSFSDLFLLSDGIYYSILSSIFHFPSFSSPSNNSPAPSPSLLPSVVPNAPLVPDHLLFEKLLAFSLTDIPIPNLLLFLSSLSSIHLPFK